MSARCPVRAGLAVLGAAWLSACTLVVRRDERELPPLRPLPPDERRALQLEVVESHPEYLHLCVTGGSLLVDFAEARPVSAAVLERHRRAWESTGLFASVENAADGAGSDADLEVRVRITRDAVESDPSNGLALLTLGLWPLLAGRHEDRLVSFDAAFRRRGELLGEITRVERLSVHRHLLLVPLAPFFGEEDATESAERDLVQAILVEAQGRGIL